MHEMSQKCEFLLNILCFVLVFNLVEELLSFSIDILEAPGKNEITLTIRIFELPTFFGQHKCACARSRAIIQMFIRARKYGTFYGVKNYKIL